MPQIKLLLVVLVFTSLSPTLILTQYTKSNSFGHVKPLYNALENFGVRLYNELEKTNSNKNIIFSPFSIQSSIAMARMGAEGNTALEIDKCLTLSAQQSINLADYYHVMLEKYEHSSVLKMANKIYVQEGYDIQDSFKKLITEKFFSSVENINFADSNAAADTINTWVESKTNNLIQGLIYPSAVNYLTRLVLVNAIHFRGKWVHRFHNESTRKQDFYLDSTNKIKVQMMHTTANFRYGELYNLDATALEMRYRKSDFSMIIILPNSRTGLAQLEKKMQNISLYDLNYHMYPTKVAVSMPKFKAEFNVELSTPLKELGMRRMFSPTAEFGKMLKSNENLEISKIVHKAFIEVNEEGTEASAASGLFMQSRSAIMDMQPNTFRVNRPFMYIIKNTKNVAIFRGSIKTKF